MINPGWISGIHCQVICSFKFRWASLNAALVQPKENSEGSDHCGWEEGCPTSPTLTAAMFIQARLPTEFVVVCLFISDVRTDSNKARESIGAQFWDAAHALFDSLQHLSFPDFCSEFVCSSSFVSFHHLLMILAQPEKQHLSFSQEPLLAILINQSFQCNLKVKFRTSTQSQGNLWWKSVWSFCWHMCGHVGMIPGHLKKNVKTAASGGRVVKHWLQSLADGCKPQLFAFAPMLTFWLMKRPCFWLFKSRPHGQKSV